MTTAPIEVICSAADLPDRWDVAAGEHLFLKRKSLLVLEETNPCGQFYHVTGGEGPSSIAVTYRHKLNLLTYGWGGFSLPVTMVGIPCSVSGSGCRLSPEAEKAMLDHLRSLRGTKLMLNTDSAMVAGFASGATLPSCRLEIRWDSFPAYLKAMRSHYRYRITKAESRWTEVTEEPVAPEHFSQDLYGLYLNVFQRSRYKLEKLEIDFFRRFPADIVAFKAGDKPIAFVQTVHNGRELIFMFTGMDYSVSKRYDTYLNVLLHIIRKGIDAGCESIDLGQTTEETKCKVGCRLVRKNLHVAHSNKIAHRALAPLVGLLSYRRAEQDYHVFR